MSSMPREEPFWGDSARDAARAGERTRVGSVEGERLAGVSEEADRGLYAGVSGATMHRHRSGGSILIDVCIEGTPRQLPGKGRNLIDLASRQHEKMTLSSSTSSPVIAASGGTAPMAP